MRFLTTPAEPILLASACLLGCRSRYDAAAPGVIDARLERWLRSGLVLPFCPETAGGLPTPRDPAEIAGRSGDAVLAGAASVLTCRGKDVTVNFVKGARYALAAARHFKIRTAVLKDGSPSCGTTRIYDGSFCGRCQPGQGVAAALLAANGIALYNEDSLAGLKTRFSKEI